MSPTSIEGNVFREVFFRPSIAREFFLPFEHARWVGGSYTLDGADERKLRPEFSGLRLQAADPNDPNQVVEKQCQNDLRKLVSTVREMRQDKALSGVVLSNELVLGQQPDSTCRRAVFGLYQPDDRFRDDNKAAEECHRQINGAIAKSGLLIERPGSFDPKTGMKGLEDWAGAVRLGRNSWPFSPYWLLLLLLIPLLLLFRGCPNREPTGSGLTSIPPAILPDDGPWKVETDSFLILVDKSGSMGPYFPQIREEAKRLLNKRITQQKKTYADIIVYDQNAASALGEIMETNNLVADRLVSYIENLKAGGGTNLESAMQLAGERVQKHGKKTTLLIVTDGEDSSIPKMLKDPAKVKGYFGNVEVKALWTTPRLLKKGAAESPQDHWERDLQEFTDIFTNNR